jgi:hypothetical protein
MERHVILTDKALVGGLIAHMVTDVDTGTQPAKYRDLLEGLAVAACEYMGGELVRIEKHPKGEWQVTIDLRPHEKDLKG